MADSPTARLGGHALPRGRCPDGDERCAVYQGFKPVCAALIRNTRESARSYTSTAALKTDEGLSPAAWSGPRVQVEHVNGIARLRVDGQPHPGMWVTFTPGTLNTPFTKPATAPTDFTTFDPLVLGAQQAGTRLLSMDFSPGASFADPALDDHWFSPSVPLPLSIRTYFDRAIKLYPRVLFILRFYVHSADLPMLVFRNASNDTDSVTCPGKANFPPNRPVCAYMNSITPQWAATTAGRLHDTLAYFDQLFPGRIAGVDPTYLATGEWNMWSEQVFSWMPDYSDAQRAAFCSWKGTGPDCAIPLPSARSTPALNDSFAAAGK
jgi:hypothetical protein